MSTYFYSSQQQHPMMSSSNHHGRSRRGQRVSSTQPNNRHMRHQQHLQQQQQQQQQQQAQQLKALEKIVASEAPSMSVFRARFEAGRSFDFDDDLEFCPNLLSWDERQSMTSGSDRSSLASGSPESSPLQQQIQPHFAPALNNAYVSPPTSYAVHNLKIHQPSAIRSRNPIPIVNPDARGSRASPPSSISPGMMQSSQRRW